MNNESFSIFSLIWQKSSIYTYQQFVGRRVAHSNDSLVEVVIHQGSFRCCECKFTINVGKRQRCILNVLLRNQPSSLVKNLCCNRCCIRIDHHDFSKSFRLDVDRFLKSHINVSNLQKRCFFLVGNFCFNNRRFISIRQINFQKHETCNIYVSSNQLVFKICFHCISDCSSVKPVVWCIPVTCNFQHCISCQFSENGIVVFLAHPVHLGKFILHKLILETITNFKLKTLFCSSGELWLLVYTAACALTTEFNSLVDSWEMDQRIKDTNKVQSPF